VPVSGLVIDRESREVRTGAAAVELTFREFELLVFLTANPGKCSPASNSCGEYGDAGPGRAPAPSTCTCTGCAASSAPGTAGA